MQSSDRTKAHRRQPTQAGGALEKRRLLAAFGYNLWKEIDHTVVRSVDAAGYVRGAEDGRLHQKFPAKIL